MTVPTWAPFPSFTPPISPWSQTRSIGLGWARLAAAGARMAARSCPLHTAEPLSPDEASGRPVTELRRVHVLQGSQRARAAAAQAGMDLLKPGSRSLLPCRRLPSRTRPPATPLLRPAARTPSPTPLQSVQAGQEPLVLQFCRSGGAGGRRRCGRALRGRGARRRLRRCPVRSRPTGKGGKGGQPAH